VHRTFAFMDLIDSLKFRGLVKLKENLAVLEIGSYVEFTNWGAFIAVWLKMVWFAVFPFTKLISSGGRTISDRLSR